MMAVLLSGDEEGEEEVWGALSLDDADAVRAVQAVVSKAAKKKKIKTKRIKAKKIKLSRRCV